ncbi:MAG: sulfite exporter TauE/SafE family protein [Bacteroidota bacterium]
MFWSALLMGLAGSFHCAGMCGPIMIALSSGNSLYGRAEGRLLYHSGRLGIYMCLGLLAGIAGKALDFNGLQQQTSVIAGVIMILMVLVVYGRPAFFAKSMFKYTQYIKSAFRNLFGRKSGSAVFMMGAVNGLLPCGLVYIAMAGSVAAGSIGESALYMLVFGAGTLPVLTGISVLGKKGITASRMGSKFTPVLVLILGVLMIWRGIHIESVSCCSH